MRAMEPSIGVYRRSSVTAKVRISDPGSHPTTAKEFKLLKKTITHINKTNIVGVIFKKLYMRTKRLVLMTGASFANARGMKSQLSYIVLIMADNGVTNFVHYSYVMFRRTTRSAMVSEVHALLLGFDQAFSIRHMLVEMIGRRM